MGKRKLKDVSVLVYATTQRRLNLDLGDIEVPKRPHHGTLNLLPRPLSLPIPSNSNLTSQMRRSISAAPEYGGGNGKDFIPKDATNPYETDEPFSPYNFSQVPTGSSSNIKLGGGGPGNGVGGRPVSSGSGGRPVSVFSSRSASGVQSGGPSRRETRDSTAFALSGLSIDSGNGSDNRSLSGPLSPVLGAGNAGFRIYGRDDLLSKPSSSTRVELELKSTLKDRSNASVTTTALARAVSEQEDYSVVDGLLFSVQEQIDIGGRASGEIAQQFVDAGLVQNLDSLLIARGVEGLGLEIVIQTIGYLAQDPPGCLTIVKSHLLSGLLSHLTSPHKAVLKTLTLWVLARLCCTLEIVQILQKSLSTSIDALPLVPCLLTNGFTHPAASTQAAFILGNTVYNDATADALMNTKGFVDTIVGALRATLTNPSPPAAMEEEVSSYLYVIARTSRSIKIAKTWHAAGVIDLIVRYLNGSDSPRVLHWAARSVGCLMRPNSSDMARALLAAGAARALARLPRVVGLEVEPLGSLAFAVQRFSAAEWGSGTRKALVAAGVVDSLLSAFRAVASLPVPEAQAEIAYAISSLCDVGGGELRKEIVRTGGIDVLKRVGDNSPNKDVQKACGLAIQTITGNILTRNTASAKTALNHNWSGGADMFR
ncbi:ARM repeat-containing protein [Atractiella rhizophila]|nr:ARM repeat-containing protein [Atractiella rhizophila]